MNMNQHAITKAEALIKSKTAEVNMGAGVTLSLLDHEGYPTTSTLSIAKADGIRQITFAATLDSNKAKRAKEDSRASICIFDDDYEGGAYYNITLVGDVEIITDIETKKETWYEGLEPHFPNGGLSDPNYCVLEFTTKRYSLWVDVEEKETTGCF